LNETNISQWTVTAAYAAAILFAIHLVTYVIAPIRDATPSSSPIVAELLALLGVAEHLLLFPTSSPFLLLACLVGIGGLTTYVAYGMADCKMN
jgi:hypothetical protein